MSKDADLTELLERFARVAALHNQATESGNYKAVNAAVREINEVFDRIKEFGDAGRGDLLALTHHVDPAVQILAACYSLSYDSNKALAVLRILAEDKGIIGFSAGQVI